MGELTTLPRSLIGWGGDTPPHTYTIPRRLRRLDLGVFGACWFAPNLYFVPARLFSGSVFANRFIHLLCISLFRHVAR